MNTNYNTITDYNFDSEIQTFFQEKLVFSFELSKISHQHGFQKIIIILGILIVGPTVAFISYFVSHPISFESSDLNCFRYIVLDILF